MDEQEAVDAAKAMAEKRGWELCEHPWIGTDLHWYAAFRMFAGGTVQAMYVGEGPDYAT